MLQPGMSYLVVYCGDVGACRDFYVSLGLEFTREQHGDAGPVHYSATLAGGAVFELYPAGAAGGVTGPLRLGLTVPVPVPVGATVGAGNLGLEPGRRLVRDPDGRTVEVTVVAE